LIAEGFPTHEDIQDYSLLEETTEEIESPNIEVDQNFNFISNLKVVKEQMFLVYKHDQSCRKKGEMVLLRTSSQGLATFLVFKCLKCQQEVKFATHTKEQKTKLNAMAVWGTLAIGIGHDQAQELLSYIGIHMMAFNTFAKFEEVLSEVIF